MSTEKTENYSEIFIEWINQGSLELHRDELMSISPALNNADDLFLAASCMIELNEPQKACELFEKCLTVSPNYDIARFQFAFYLLTLGQQNAFLEVISPITHKKIGFLSLFSQGLVALSNGEHDKAYSFLNEGIAANIENPALNNDMQLLITSVLDRKMPPKTNHTDETEQVDVMSNSLLDIYRSKMSK